MYKHIITLVFVCFSGVCIAQKTLLFYNTQLNKTIELKEGHRAAILYKGYQNQIEFAMETVTLITDSTIVLGIDLATLLPNHKPGKMNKLMYKVIRITDIVGFRRMTLGRQIAKLTFSIAGIVGSFYILNGVYSSNISNFNAFMISLGAGFGILGLNHLIFPENIKYYFSDGWQVKVLSK
jgi:hypothetical protein